MAERSGSDLQHRAVRFDSECVLHFFMKVLHTFEKEIVISLNYEEKNKAIRLLSLHYLGDEECNKKVNGRFVAKYPEKETTEFKETHYACHRSYIKTVQVDLMEDGSLRLKK